MICTFSEQELQNLKAAFSIGLERYLRKLSGYNIHVPKAFKKEQFKIAYFTQDFKIRIITVKFSKYFLLNLQENSPFIHYSSIVLNYNEQCNVKQGIFHLPKEISHITSTNCCFQVYSSSREMINVCLLRKLCIYKTLIFIKTLNSGCFNRDRGGLILSSKPPKPKILRNLKNKNLRIFLKKKYLNNNESMIKNMQNYRSFCDSKSFCEKMKILNLDDLSDRKELREYSVKLKDNQIFFNANQNIKFQSSLNLKNVINIREFETPFVRNALNKNNSEICLMVEINLNRRNTSKLFCAKPIILNKFFEKFKGKIKPLPTQNNDSNLITKIKSSPKKTIDSSLKIKIKSLPKQNSDSSIKIKTMSLSKENSNLSLKNNAFFVAYYSEGDKFFKEITINVQSNEILGSNNKKFMGYEQIKNCDFCYNPQIPFDRLKDGKCCFKFTYNGKDRMMCLKKENYKVKILIK